MDSLTLYFGMGMTALAACTVLGLIGLKGFTAWIELKRAEIGAGIGAGIGNEVSTSTPTIGQRIDVADLKERVRRLEAIAAGVDI
jgi:hypothetical protein